jgi:leader peptidase (prepilin peptidase) / N-methyltransferase
MFMMEGMELLMIASGPLVGGIVGMFVDRYPAPYPDDDDDQDGERDGEQPPVLPSLHPGVEIACTLTGAVAALALPAPLSLFAAALGWVLLTLALIDLRHLEVPDALSLPLIPAGLAATWWIEPQAILVHAAAAAAGAVTIWLLGEAFRRLRGRAGIGGGDVRLFAVAGAWVGLAPLPAVLFLSGIFGLIAATFLVHRGWVAWGDRIPFVPALSAALWVVFLVPQLVQP